MTDRLPRRRLHELLLLGLLLALLVPATHSEVVHVRGPLYDGIDRTSSIALPFPTNGPVLLWKRTLGQGFSGVIVAGNRVFTQFQERGGQYLACLDAATGATVWQTRYDWPWQPDGQWPGPYATPTYADGRIFFAGAQGLVGAADAEHGRLLWSRNILLEFRGKSMHFGYACTPLVHDGKVFLNAGSPEAAFLALNASDGGIAWKTGSDTASYSSPILATCRGETQVIAFLEIATMGCDPVTGAQRWYNLWGGGYNAHGTWPLWHEPYLYRTVPFKHGSRVDRITRTYDVFAAQQVWANHGLSCDFMTPVIMSGHIYGFDVFSVQASRRGRTPGEFVCLDLETGATKWRTDSVGHASVIGCGDKLVLLNEYGTLIIAAADPVQYRELARAPLMTGGLYWTTPTLQNNLLFVRNHESIACFRLGADTTPMAGIRASSADARSTRHWLDAFPARQLWSPTLPDLAIWFVFNVAGVFGLAWIAHLPFRGRPWSVHVLLALALVAAVACLRPLSLAIGRLVFTWPAAINVLFFWVLVAGALARERGGMLMAWVARASLALFATVCAGYVHVCSRLMILAGWGFLTGLICAAPLMYAAARRMVRGEGELRVVPLIILGFTVHFWTSAIVILWRANAGGEIADY